VPAPSRCERPAGVATQDVSGADRAQLAAYAAVAFGRAVRAEDCERMRRAFREANPEVSFVDGLAPITPLLVAQFEQALDRRPAVERTLAGVAVDRDRLELELRGQTHVQVTGYRLTRLSLPRAHIAAP
jgi:hypothetical protein